MINNDLTTRLRKRITTIPKPGSKPFDPPAGFAYTTMMGGEHKPGDPAGYASVNVNLTGCSTAQSVFKMQEMVYAEEPLSWEAAAALEHLQAELLEYQQCLDAGIEHRMRRKAETEAESLRAECERMQTDYDRLLARDTDNLKKLIACQAELATALEDASELRALDNEAQHGADALRAELAACKADAERYRWLRSLHAPSVTKVPKIWSGPPWDETSTLWWEHGADEAVDAARAQAGDSQPPDNWHEPADGRRLAKHNKGK